MKIRYGDHYRHCPECGKPFFIPDYETYVFKRDRTYFCKWSCMRKFDAKHEKPKNQSQYERVKSCSDCVHNVMGENGYRICHIGISKYLYEGKAACRRYSRRVKNNG